MFRPSHMLFVGAIVLVVLSPATSNAGGRGGRGGGGGAAFVHAPVANAPIKLNPGPQVPSHVVALPKPTNAGAKNCHQRGPHAGWHGVSCT
jgi:hypothetical protein